MCEIERSLGSAQVQLGKRVRFFNVVELVNQLVKEQTAGNPAQMARRLIQVDVVILDELRYIPFPKSGDALLFHCRLFHAAGRNLTDRAKLSCVFTYHAEDNCPLPGSRSAQYASIPL